MKRLLTMIVAAALLAPPAAGAQDARGRYNQEMADVAENAELCAGMFSVAVDNNWFSSDAAKVRRLRDLWVGWLERNRGAGAVARARQVAQNDVNRFGSAYANSMIRSCMARDPKALEGEVEKRYVRSPASPGSVSNGQLRSSYNYAAMCAGLLGSITEGGVAVDARSDVTQAFRYWNWHAGILGARLGRTGDKTIRTDGFDLLRREGHVQGLFRVTASGAEFGSRCKQEGDMGYAQRGGRF